jgi:hypothetical protein
MEDLVIIHRQDRLNEVIVILILKQETSTPRERAAAILHKVKTWSGVVGKLGLRMTELVTMSEEMNGFAPEPWHHSLKQRVLV